MLIGMWGQNDLIRNRRRYDGKLDLAFEYHEQKYNWDNRIVPQVNDFVDVDYSAVARAFGARGSRITDARDLPDALHEAVQANELILLDVIVDKEVHAPVSVYEHVLPRSI